MGGNQFFYARPDPEQCIPECGPRLILRGAEVGLRPGVIILRRGVEVTVVMVVVVVVLRRRIVVVMVVIVALDVGVGEQERGRGGRRVLDRGHARCQSSVALDGAVPAGHAQLGGGGEETGGWDKKR